MSKLWRFRPEAEREVDDAIDWYEREQAGLGQDFVQRLREVLVSLQQRPSLAGPVPGSPRSADVRRYRLQRFPYVVIFVEVEDEYQVLAVAHLRRRPNYWRSRLKP